MLAGIGLATSSTSSTMTLSNPRVVGVIAALVGSLLLSNGLWATSLRGGWRVVAFWSAVVGAAAIVIGMVGFSLNRWTTLSAAAAVCAVAGLFGVLPLMTAGIRAQSPGWAYGSALGAFVAPWAVAAVVVVTAPGPSTRGFEAAVIPGVVIYAFVWSILKGLLVLFSGGTNPPAVGPAAAMSATLRGKAMIAGVVAAVMGSAILLLHATGASADTRTIVVVSLLLGLPAVAFLIGLAWLLLPNWFWLPHADQRDGPGVLLAVALVIKAYVLLVFPAWIAPGAVLAAGGVCVTAGLIAHMVPASPASLLQDLPPASDASKTPHERGQRRA
jgi:hypothetical protein